MSTNQLIQEMQKLGSDISTLLNYLALSEDNVLDFEVVDKSSNRVLWKHLVYMDSQGRLVRILVYDDGRRQRTSPTKLRDVQLAELIELVKYTKNQLPSEDYKDTFKNKWEEVVATAQGYPQLRGSLD
jgi:hypothetical protein